MSEYKPEHIESSSLNERTGFYQPPSTFHPNSLRLSSLEEMALENLLYSLSLKPVERWKYLHELNLNAFGKETALLKDFGKTITIKP